MQFGVSCNTERKSTKYGTLIKFTSIAFAVKCNNCVDHSNPLIRLESCPSVNIKINQQTVTSVSKEMELVGKMNSSSGNDQTGTGCAVVMRVSENQQYFHCPREQFVGSEKI